MLFSYNIKQEVLNANEVKGYLLAQTENNDFVELHINSNGIVPAHSLPINVTFYVVSGNGVLSISDKQFKASQGDVLHVNKNAERAWENPYSQPLKLLVIKQKQTIS